MSDPTDGSTAWRARRTRIALDRFTAQLRSGVDVAARVPNLSWTVADLGAHLACMPRLYRHQNETGPDFERPDDFAAYSDSVRAHITETDPAALADLIETEIGRYLDEAVADAAGGDENRWLYGEAVTAGQICGLLLNELVCHGRDLAAVTGAERPTLSRDEANAVIDGMMMITPRFVDPVKAAAAPDGVYGLRFRGGRDWTWRLAGDTLSITEGRPTSADARLNADPTTFVLASLNRISQARAALSGGMVAYGRKPWRFAGLGSITADGV